MKLSNRQKTISLALVDLRPKFVEALTGNTIAAYCVR